MKLSKYITIGVMALTVGGGAASCTGDLDLHPDDPQTKTELKSKDEWLGYFSSLYAGFLYKGNLATSDDGAGSFTRCHWNLQEITADEAIISKKWADPGYDALNFNLWLNDNEWVYAAFSREFYTAKQASEFIARSADAVAYLGEEEVEAMKAEARVIRAYAYMQMIDLFGRGPWIDENSVTGSVPPTYNRQELFDAVTADLVAVLNEGHLRPGSSQIYGRLSEQAARMVLAKLYLNAEVYTGTPMYAQCAEQCTKIATSGLSLAQEYKYLFCASNDKYVGTGEIIWGLPQQVGAYETWGGTTYMTAGAYIESAAPEVLASLGAGKLTDSGEFDGPNPWSGLRVRPELSKALAKNDARRLIYEGDYNEDIVDLVNYDSHSDGYMCIKYTYTSEDDYYNTANAGRSSQMCDADYPLFRLADTYLMLAECQLKGVNCDGLKYYNMVRERAGLPAAAAITSDDLLKERMCELYFEGWRRSDLIRFGKYAGNNYVWSYKGGVYEGASVPEYRKVFAIPYQYISTVGQNEGYN